MLKTRFKSKDKPNSRKPDLINPEKAQKVFMEILDRNMREFNAREFVFQNEKVAVVMTGDRHLRDFAVHSGEPADIESIKDALIQACNTCVEQIFEADKLMRETVQREYFAVFGEQV